MFYETLDLKNTQTHHIFQLCLNNAIYFLMYVLKYVSQKLFSRYLYGFQWELFRVCGKTYTWFSAYVQREGKKENCVDNFLPSVSKMHLNWTVYVTWSFYSLWHNSDLFLFSKLSLHKTNSIGWWPALLSSSGSPGTTKLPALSSLPVRFSGRKGSDGKDHS